MLDNSGVVVGLDLFGCIVIGNYNIIGYYVVVGVKV